MLSVSKPYGLLWLSAALFSVSTWGIGTAPATIIDNQAAVTFSLGGPPVTTNTNTTTLLVDEMLDYTVTWQDPGNVSVASGQANAVLTFELVNNGNGTESFSLLVNNVIGGDNFDPVLTNDPVDTDIYLDDGDGIFNIALDTLYDPGVNDPILVADATLIIFVHNNIPLGLNANDLGDSALSASANTGTGPIGTAFDCDGVFNVNGIDGGDDCVNPGTLVDALTIVAPANASATGTYIVSDVVVTINKSFTLLDLLGGNQPLTGATITYVITVSVSGTGTASNVVITDSICSPGPFPACGNTSYLAGTLQLNAAPAFTDAADGDVGNYNDPVTTNLITVDLGDMTAATPLQTITFDAIIN